MSLSSPQFAEQLKGVVDGMASKTLHLYVISQVSNNLSSYGAMFYCEDLPSKILRIRSLPSCGRHTFSPFRLKSLAKRSKSR
jgi:hypothetical protein